MSTRHIIVIAAVVLFMNLFFLVGAPEEACARAPCQTVYYCLNETCENTQTPVMESTCTALCNSLAQGCCLERYRCDNDCAGGNGELTCRCKRPCS